MALVTDEISDAMNSLSLDDSELIRLPDDKAKVLYYELLDTFVEGGDRKWWWESFKKETKSIALKDNKSFKKILSLIPRPKDRVWFIAEEDQMSYYPIYEGTTEVIVKIIGECYSFEYYIVPMSKEWILCENHHNTVIGSGEEIVNYMQSKNA